MICIVYFYSEYNRQNVQDKQRDKDLFYCRGTCRFYQIVFNLFTNLFTNYQFTYIYTVSKNRTHTINIT